MIKNNELVRTYEYAYEVWQCIIPHIMTQRLEARMMELEETVHC
jgi:hypothetical protein